MFYITSLVYTCCYDTGDPANRAHISHQVINMPLGAPCSSASKQASTMYNRPSARNIYRFCHPAIVLKASHSVASLFSGFRVLMVLDSVPEILWLE